MVAVPRNHPLGRARNDGETFLQRTVDHMWNGRTIALKPLSPQARSRASLCLRGHPDAANIRALKTGGDARTRVGRCRVPHHAITDPCRVLLSLWALSFSKEKCCTRQCSKTGKVHTWWHSSLFLLRDARRQENSAAPLSAAVFRVRLSRGKFQ